MGHANARVVAKLLAQRTDGWAEGEATDAGFDGGEFSGPAWADIWIEEVQRTIQDVAAILDVPPVVLEREWGCYVNATEVWG